MRATMKLGSVTKKIGSGVTPRGGEKVYKTEGTTLIRSQNVYDYRFVEDGLVYIDDTEAERMKGVEIQKNDVLINITGDSVGRCCIVPDKVLPARVNQHVCILRADPSQLNPRYLMYFLNEPKNKQRLLNQVHGGTRKALTKGILEVFEITIPSLRTQEKIAEILGSLDDKIELNRRMNETLEQMVMALYKHWFVDFGPFYDLDDSGFPIGWRWGTLDEIGHTYKFQVDPTELETYLPYIGLEHMPKGSVSLEEWGYTDKVKSNKFLFEKGDILFGKLRPYFKKVGVAPINGVCSTDILVLRPKNDDFFGLLFTQVIQDEFIDYCSNTSNGTKMPRCDWNQMGKFTLRIPTDSVLIEFNKKIKAFVDQIISNIHENKVLIETRDYLLPRLLSGEIEVREAEEQVEEVLANA